jgi:hypothetical protein
MDSLPIILLFSQEIFDSLVPASGSYSSADFRDFLIPTFKAGAS